MISKNDYIGLPDPVESAALLQKMYDWHHLKIKITYLEEWCKMLKNEYTNSRNNWSDTKKAGVSAQIQTLEQVILILSHTFDWEKSK